MAQCALFVGWGALITGREKAAQNLLNDARQYLKRLQQAGGIESIEAVALKSHGGDLDGFVLVSVPINTYRSFYICDTIRGHYPSLNTVLHSL